MPGLGSRLRPRRALARIHLGCMAVGVLELYGAGPAQGGVAAQAVVGALDVREDRGGQLDAGVPASSVENLNLQACPEGLGDGVVVGFQRSSPENRGHSK